MRWLGSTTLLPITPEVAMKRVIAALVGLLAAVATVSPVAAGGYPPATPTVESSSSSPTAGSSITLTATGFCPGSTVTFTISGVGTVGTSVADDSGSASVTIAAPATPGTYTVTASSTAPPSDPTAVADPCTDVAELEITVLSAGPVLPGTGSNTTMPGLQIGIIAVLAGGALVGLATIRRRRLA